MEALHEIAGNILKKKMFIHVKRGLHHKQIHVVGIVLCMGNCLMIDGGKDNDG